MKFSKKHSIKVLTRNNSEIYCNSILEDDGSVHHPDVEWSKDFVVLHSVDGNSWVIPTSSVDYIRIVDDENVEFEEDDD